VDIVLERNGHAPDRLARTRDASAGATALRGAALRDASTLRSTFKFIMILAVAITGVVLVANSPAPVVEAACLHCTRSLVPVDEPTAATHIASFPRTSRAE